MMIIIGHRGCGRNTRWDNRDVVPENTIGSFMQAVQRGFKWIEFDVQMTRDGEVIVLHDDEILYSSGTGHEHGHGKRVKSLQVSDVSRRRLSGLLRDCIIYRRDEDSNLVYKWRNVPKRVPTLKQVLRSRVLGLSGLIGINIELKVQDEMPSERMSSFVTAVLDCVGKYNMQYNIVFSSFNFNACIELVHKCSNEHSVCWLTDGPITLDIIRRCRRVGICGIVSHVSSLKFVRQYILDYAQRHKFVLWCYGGVNEHASGCIVD